ncbi:MAG: hypothetical protein AB2992_07145 (plasmid) [Candidatus Symbiodolus clandestinus]
MSIIGLKLGKPYAVSIGTYVVSNCSNEKHPEKLTETIELLANAMPGIREDIMTLAQQLEHRGLQQGEHNKAFEIAKRMLEAKIDLEAIKNCTGLSDQEISRL